MTSDKMKSYKLNAISTQKWRDNYNRIFRKEENMTSKKYCDNCRWWKEKSRATGVCKAHGTIASTTGASFLCGYWESREEFLSIQSPELKKKYEDEYGIR